MYICINVELPSGCQVPLELVGVMMISDVTA